MIKLALVCSSRHQGKAVLADDVLGKLRDAFPAGMTEDPAEFLGRLKEQAAPPAAAYGELMLPQTGGSSIEVRQAKLASASGVLKVC